MPICDIIVLSVKSYDLTNATKSIEKITDKKTIILPLLNGVDIYERIRKHLLTGIILRSCVYIGAHIESPGIIFQQGGNCNIFIGNDPRFPDLFPHSLVKLLEEAKIDYKWDENIEVSIWSKYIFIAAYGLVSATYEKTLGEILNDLELCEITRSIMSEIELIARSMNIPLIDNILDTSFLKAKQFPYETKTSFQRDVELRGKINEIDLFGETLIRYSVKNNIPIPNIKDIYDKFLRKF